MAGERGKMGAFVIEIKGDGGDAAGRELCGFLGRTGCGNDLDRVVEEEDGRWCNCRPGRWLR